MPIKSYLIYPHEGQQHELIEALANEPCEIVTSENRNVLVLVSDTKDQNQEDQFLENLSGLRSLDHYTLVSGFNS